MKEEVVVMVELVIIIIMGTVIVVVVTAMVMIAIANLVDMNDAAEAVVEAVKGGEAEAGVMIEVQNTLPVAAAVVVM